MTKPAFLQIPIGSTSDDQVRSLQAIKDAMAMAMIHSWEADGADPSNNTFMQVSTIYLEANTQLHSLNRGSD